MASATRTDVARVSGTVRDLERLLRRAAGRRASTAATPARRERLREQVGDELRRSRRSRAAPPSASAASTTMDPERRRRWPGASRSGRTLTRGSRCGRAGAPRRAPRTPCAGGSPGARRAGRRGGSRRSRTGWRVDRPCPRNARSAQRHEQRAQAATLRLGRDRDLADVPVRARELAGQEDAHRPLGPRRHERRLGIEATAAGAQHERLHERAAQARASRTSG